MIDEKINGYIDVIEHPHIFIWFENLAKKNPIAYDTFVSYNKQKISRFLGRAKKNPNSKWSLCWYYTFDRLQFKILTDQDLGTVFLVKTITTKEDFKNDNRLSIGIKNFLDLMYKNICGEN